MSARDTAKTERERAVREHRHADYWTGWQHGRTFGRREIGPSWWFRIKERFGR